MMTKGATSPRIMIATAVGSPANPISERSVDRRETALPGFLVNARLSLGSLRLSLSTLVNLRGTSYMSGKTGIEWTSATWNPSIGCEIVSPGCAHCYAMRQARRLESNPVLKPNPYKGTTKATKGGPVWTGVVRMAPRKTLLKPLGWRKPNLIFVNSMSDLFHSSLKTSEIAQIFAVMAIGGQHIYQVLTKRPDIMHAFITDPATPASVELAMQTILPGSRLPSWPLKNVWMGTSVEDQRRAGERVQALLQVPAAVRFLSMEPLIGEVLLDQEMTRKDWKKLHWVIVGGESGPKARPMHPEWARKIRDDCIKYGVRFFFKQVGSNAWVKDRKAEEFLTVAGRIIKQRQNSSDQGILRGSKKSGGRKLDGQLHEDMPTVFPSYKASRKAA
jgi:protein gp37